MRIGRLSMGVVVAIAVAVAVALAPREAPAHQARAAAPTEVTLALNTDGVALHIAHGQVVVTLEL